MESSVIRYMISGSVASMAYGEPRLTNDVDIILSLDLAKISDLTTAFPQSDFYCPPEDVIAVELRRPQRGRFNLIHHDTGHKADIYTLGSDPLLQWELENRRSIELAPNIAVWIAPPEYVILQKLMFYREGRSEKHILDIRGILDVAAEQINQDFLQAQISELQLERVWALIHSTWSTAMPHSTVIDSIV